MHLKEVGVSIPRILSNLALGDPCLRFSCMLPLSLHSLFLQAKSTQVTQEKRYTLLHLGWFDNTDQRIAVHVTLDWRSRETGNFVPLMTKEAFINMADHILPNNYKTVNHFLVTAGTSELPWKGAVPQDTAPIPQLLTVFHPNNKVLLLVLAPWTWVTKIPQDTHTSQFVCKGCKTKNI